MIHEPDRSGSPQNGSRSPSRICEPKDTWPQCSAFSISTCTQIPSSGIVNNTHSHCTTSPVPVSASPAVSILNFNSTPKRNKLRVPSPLSLSPSPTPLLRSAAPSPLRLSTLLSPTSTTTPTPTLVTAIAAAPSASSNTPHSSLLFSTEMPQIHHPKPQHPTSPSTSGSSSNAHRPTTPHRPPSRSEKLLREALMKDEHERNPLPYTASSPNMARSPVRGHQRRHSHIPSSTTSHVDQQRAEDLARGNFLFRSAMLGGGGVNPNPRSSSPSPTPDSRDRRHSTSQGHHRQNGQYHHDQQPSPPYAPGYDANPNSSHLTRRSSVKSAGHPHRPASPCSPHSRGYTTQQSPPYTPSVASSHLQQSPALSRRQVPRPLPLSPSSDSQGEVLTMTPHEQVLRARLERVLQTSSSPPTNHRSPLKSGNKHDLWAAGVDDDDETDSSGDDNVVRDENGGWAWGSKQQSPVPANAVSMMAVTPPSSGSNSARSISREDMHSMAPSLSSSSSIHQRSRSRTEPAPVVPGGQYASPKRTATSPSVLSSAGGAAYHHHQRGGRHHHHHHGHSGTTPPLVSDGSPTPEEEDEDDPEDLRLLTPPPTPPSAVPAQYHHGKEFYMPSPYKTSFDLRRPSANPPLAMLRNDRSRGTGGYSDDDDDGYDHEYEDDECSCSGCSGSASNSVPCSRLSSRQHHPRTQSMAHYGGVGSAHPTRPQFNARRASARCRQMDGYVSFAAVEGLGAPPETESSDDNEEEKKRRMKREGAGSMTEWVRWTKRRLLGGNEQEEARRHQQHQQQPHSVVL